MLFGMINFSRK